MKDIPEHHEALKLPNPADILDGKIDKMPDGISFSGQYAMVASLEYELRDRYREKGHNTDFYNDTAIYLDFIYDNFPKELCIFSIRNIMMHLGKKLTI